MKSKFKARILMFLIFIVLIVFTISITLNNVYYNPYKKTSNMGSVFSSIMQVISPNTTYSSLNQEKNIKLLSFGSSKQKFFIRKEVTSLHESKNENKGIFNYNFGQIEISDYENILNIENFSVKQNVFLDEKYIEDFNYNNINTNSYYDVWMKFTIPINSQTLYSTYDKLLSPLNIDRTNAGVYWVAIKTDDDSDSVCIGMRGNLSLHYMNIENANFDTYYHMDEFSFNDEFINTIQYLNNRQKESNILFDSGLFGENMEVDFNNRLQYIKKNGIECLGMVINIKGDLLINMPKTNIEIIKMENENNI